MEYFIPDEISLDAVTRELIEDAKKLSRTINNSRPLPEESLTKIKQELLGEQVYNSNAIEGSSITLRETRHILQTGEIVDVGRKREATETLNLGRATAEIEGLIQDPESWGSLERFINVHRILLSDVLDEGAGVIRSQRVMITGARHQPPNPAMIENLLARLFGVLKRADQHEPILLATWTHWSIARIHPFLDGNGRMARLWQDLILFGNHYTAAIIRQQDRNEYYGALGAADEGNFNPLTQLVCRSLSKTLQIYVNAQREVDELKDWAAKITGETQSRLDERRKLEYVRWTRQMEQIRDAFERCATQLTSVSDGTIELQIRSFDIIDQSTWETLRSGGRVAKTWFFWANFRRGQDRIQYCFFFGRHFFGPEDRAVSSLGPSACLLVSEQVADESPVRLGESDDNRVTLREVLVVEGKILRKRLDVASGNSVYDHDVDPLQVAQDFAQEVLLHRLG
ncbi:MAG: Fic family protein [Pirellulaceae bacterium]